MRVRYFATFRESAGTGEECIATQASTLAELYSELKGRHGFQMKNEQLRAARNLEMCDLSAELADGDEIVFIPPVAGG